LGEETGLAHKGFAPAELFRIDELQKHRGTPARFAIGAAMTAEGVGERFNEQAQGKTFAAQIRSAQRQDGSATIVEEHHDDHAATHGAHDAKNSENVGGDRVGIAKGKSGKPTRPQNELNFISRVLHFPLLSLRNVV
jgi:hypothetical protein